MFVKIDRYCRNSFAGVAGTGVENGEKGRGKRRRVLSQR